MYMHHLIHASVLHTITWEAAMQNVLAKMSAGALSSSSCCLWVSLHTVDLSAAHGPSWKMEEQGFIQVALNFYRTNKEGTAEKASFSKSRVPCTELKEFSEFKQLLINYLGIKEKVDELGFGDFSLKLFRIEHEGQKKVHHFEIFTSQQYEVEMNSLLQKPTTNELNGR